MNLKNLKQNENVSRLDSNNATSKSSSSNITFSLNEKKVSAFKTDNPLQGFKLDNNKKRKRSWLKITLIILLLIVISAASYGGYFYYQRYKELQSTGVQNVGLLDPINYAISAAIPKKLPYSDAVSPCLLAQFKPH